VLTPEQEEGPFYVDVGLLRSDITEGRTGVPLDLTITVVDAATCEPRPDAAVDIWHADPTGLYSDEDSEGTAGQTFLRGIQVTGADGVARFTTLVPGWYTGRTLHIHVKVRLGGQTSGTSFRGGNVSHTGQLFFDPSFDDDLAAAPDYAANANGHTTNAADSIYSGQDGSSSVLDTAGSVDAGYTGTITLAVDTGGGGASKT
jgi:protocatechuate 3,4-dioxygenase beta subunit